MKSFLEILVYIASYITGIALFILGVLAGIEIVLGTKYYKILLEKFGLLWITEIYWKAFLFFLVLFIVIYVVQQKVFKD